VFEVIAAGGWLMLPIILSSIAAMGIVIERFWSLQRSRVLPNQLVTEIAELWRTGRLDDAALRDIAEQSALGRVLASGLRSLRAGPETMKETIEDTGRHVAHDLERFLNSLGTIAAVTPLLGLLGTVIGMIDVFATITTAGVGEPGELAAGISKALVTTAAGLSVAIPALMFYRFFRRRVDELLIDMEREALKVVAMAKAAGGGRQ